MGYCETCSMNRANGPMVGVVRELLVFTKVTPSRGVPYTRTIVIENISQMTLWCLQQRAWSFAELESV
jgi:hypothetical protein